MNPEQGGRGCRRQECALIIRTLLFLGLACGVTTPGYSQTVPIAATSPKPLDPVAAEIETNRAILDFEQGRHDAVLQRLKPIAPEASPRASYFRGLSLLSLKQAREALSQFESVRRQPGAPSEVLLDSALAHLSLGESAQAQAILDRYLKQHPNDPYGHYFMGVALFRQKKYDAATAELNQAATDVKLAPFLDFYRGLSSYAQGGTDYGRHLEQFRSATTGEGAAGTAGALSQQLLGTTAGNAFRQGQSQPLGRPSIGPNGVEGPDPDRRWNLAILSGYDYDTNVALVPSLAFTPIGIGARGQARDSRWTLSSFGDYRIVQNDEWVLGLIGSTYDTWQFRLDEYNFQDYMAGSYTNLALGERWILGGRYEFHESLLGGKQFATDHRVTPNLTFREGSLGHTTAYYEFEALNLSNLPILVPAQNRSGTINSVGITQAFYLMEGAGRLFLGYRYDRANTKGLDYDRETSQLDARLEIPLPGKMVANIDGRYFFNNYLHPNSLDFFGNARRDRMIEARAGIQKFFTPHLSLRVEYVYSNNDSNVENLFGVSPFTFNRNVLSTQLIYDF